MQTISCFNYSILDFFQKSWDVGQKEAKLQNLITSRAKRAFQMKLKSFFIIFEGHYVGET